MANKPSKADYEAATKVLEYLRSVEPMNKLRSDIDRILFRLKWDRD